MPVVGGGEDVEEMVVCMMVVVCVMVVVCMVVVLKEEMEGGGEWFRAMARMVGVSQSRAALYPCAEPMCEAAENLSHVSSGVLVTVKSMIYSNKEYSVFGNLCKQADGDNAVGRERPCILRTFERVVKGWRAHARLVGRRRGRGGPRTADGR